MKPTIKVKFVDFSVDTVPERTLYYKILSRHFKVELSDHPDYLLAGGQRFEHYRYGLEVVKILLLVENVAPDFNEFDYVAGFDRLEFGDRYVRFPFCAYSGSYKTLADRPAVSEEALLDRKFCSFVVSNVQFGSPMRKLFFERLSKYKKVDSGGRWLNNVGSPVKNKIEFCKGYKFNIAFENSSYPGYVTEKIVDAYSAGTLPIYYGDPSVGKDFRPESMVCVKDEADIERAVEEVIRLDNDDAAYLEKLRVPCLVHADPEYYEKRFEEFLVRIFMQPPETVVRRCAHGRQAMMRSHLKKIMGVDQWLCNLRAKLHV